MYVCVCNNITDTELTDIINEHQCVSMTELKEYGICDNCTKCFDSALSILNDCVDERFKDQEWYISPKERCHWEIKV